MHAEGPPVFPILLERNHVRASLLHFYLTQTPPFSKGDNGELLTPNFGATLGGDAVSLGGCTPFFGRSSRFPRDTPGGWIGRIDSNAPPTAHLPILSSQTLTDETLNARPLQMILFSPPNPLPISTPLTQAIIPLQQLRNTWRVPCCRGRFP